MIWKPFNSSNCQSKHIYWTNLSNLNVPHNSNTNKWLQTKPFCQSHLYSPSVKTTLKVFFENFSHYGYQESEKWLCGSRKLMGSSMEVKKKIIQKQNRERERERRGHSSSSHLYPFCYHPLVPVTTIIHVLEFISIPVDIISMILQQRIA